jgi:outer membrane protein assembly factor BamB
VKFVRLESLTYTWTIAMVRNLIAGLLLIVLASDASAQENWPQFRGPGATGVATQPLPTKWDKQTNIAWSLDIPGRGWSSPVVWGDKVFVTSVLNDKTPKPRPGLYIEDLKGKIPPGEHVWKLTCIDFNTGKPLWDKVVHRGSPGEPIHLKNTYASETPVTDGERVYVYFGNLGLYCYDMKGELVWSKSIAPQKMRTGWGTGSSPVVHEGRVYLMNDNEESSYLAAFDKRTGNEIWKVDRDEKSNWGTPLVWSHKSRTEIVTAGTNRVRSYGLDGKLLWELKGMSIISIPTPFAGPEHLYVTSGYVLDLVKPLYAIKPGASGDVTLKPKETTNEAIAWMKPAAGPYHPTPVMYDGRVYVLLDRGFLSCYDAATGKEIYVRERIDAGADKFTSSPWAADGKIYCLSEDGETFVIRAGDKFEVLERNPLGEMTLATPALVRGNIILRTASKLYRIGTPKEKPTLDTASAVLKNLADFDSIYESGFTVSAICQTNDFMLFDRRRLSIGVSKRWKLTMEGERIGYRMDLMDYEKPKNDQPIVTSVRNRQWGYWGKDLSGNHYEDKVLEISADGTVTENGTMHNSSVFAPNGLGPIAPKQTFLWSLGRFFSKQLDKVDKVEKSPAGLLLVSASGRLRDGIAGRWQLQIEPGADWIVRKAQFYGDDDGDRVRAEITNEGTFRSGAYCIPKKAAGNCFGTVAQLGTVHFTYDPAVEKFDAKLYAEAQNAVARNQAPNLTVIDHRGIRPVVSEPNRPKR